MIKLWTSFTFDRVRIIFIIVLVHSSLYLQGQDTDSLPYTWLVELADSVLDDGVLCRDCLVKPTIKQFVTPAGETQYRYNFSCGTDFNSTIIYNEAGIILGQCIIDGVNRDCDNGIGTAFTGFTFAESINEIWTCLTGFSCESQTDLDIFTPFEIETERLSCESPLRRLTTSEPFFDYTWIDPMGTEVNGVETIATVSGDYTVIVRDAMGCRDTMVTLLDLDDFELKVDGSPLICGDEGTTLSATGYTSYEWSTGGVDSSFWFDMAGMYSLVATDRLGCRDTATFNIGDLSRRQVTIALEQEPIFVGQPARLLPQLDSYIPDQIASINWTTSSGSLSCVDCFSPELTINNSAQVLVRIVDADGCTQSDSLLLDPLQAYKEAYAGNIFSPNGDGQHDLFQLQSIPETMLIEAFKIYDRWGNEVHSAPPHQINDRSAAWDGNYQNAPAPLGTYLWLAEVRFTDGSQEIMRGSVTLVR